VASKGFLALATLLCSACAFQSQVDRATVDYNQAVANSTNELMLLNVVRAMKRYPLHFTTISKISGSFKVSGRAGLGMDVNENGGSSKLSPVGALLEESVTLGTEKFTPSLGADIAAGPSFDIGVLDTQEFYQGILRSVEPDMVANFLNQGWPDDLVAAMLIERVEFHVPATEDTKPLAQQLKPTRYEGKEAVWILENNPRSPDFRNFLHCFRLKPSSKAVPADALLPVSKIEGIKVADLLLVDGEKLALSPGADPAQRVFQRLRPAIRGITFRDVTERRLSAEACAFTLEPEARGHAPQRVSVDIYHHAADGGAEQDDPHGDEPGVVVELTRPGQQDLPDSQNREEVPASIHIVLRSPQAVIYYLGEYSRQLDEALGGQGEEPYRLRDGSRLIVVAAGHDGPAFLKTRLNGVSYSVPSGWAHHGRSPTSLDLAQQLINLNKSAKDKPSTSSFRLVD
jgi:hypothetical protein